MAKYAICPDARECAFSSAGSRPRKLQALGILSGFTAGAWLGAAEAPTKLVSVGVSPIVISLIMVTGVFLARWSVPALILGTSSVRADLRRAPHLIIWALLAGCLWAVANTMTIFAIRDIGLSIAFPLWNSNSLLGILWGFIFFNELRQAGWRRWTGVLGGALVMCVGAALLAIASSTQAPAAHSMRGVWAALGAGILWGTMYIPYRKAYLSGMNPLSFVTFFTFGELGMMSRPRHRISWTGPAVAGIDQRARRALLADAGRLHLGDRRCLSAIRREICRHQSRHSAIQFQSTLGIVVGHFCFRRVARQRRLHLLASHWRFAADDAGSGGHRLFVRRRQRAGPLAGSLAARIAALQHRGRLRRGPHAGNADGGRSPAAAHMWDWLLVAVATGIFVFFATLARAPRMSFHWGPAAAS